MKNTSNQSDFIFEYLRKKLHYAVRVHRGEEVFYIAEIFGVSPDMHEKVKNTIFDLDENDFAEMEFIILPMVYTMDETMTYFPDEYAKLICKMTCGSKHEGNRISGFSDQKSSPSREMAFEFKAA